MRLDWKAFRLVLLIVVIVALIGGVTKFLQMRSIGKGLDQQTEYRRAFKNRKAAESNEGG